MCPIMSHGTGLTESIFRSQDADPKMKSPDLTIIVAATNKMGIGRNGMLPWTGLKKEMAYFARVTKRSGSMVCPQKSSKSSFTNSLTRLRMQSLWAARPGRAYLPDSGL